MFHDGLISNVNITIAFESFHVDCPLLLLRRPYRSSYNTIYTTGLLGCINIDNQNYHRL